jgi:flagellar protein FliJ
MARPKPFRYHTLLRVRERQEELRAMALAEVRREIHVNQVQQDEIIASQRRALSDAGRATREEFDAVDVRRYFLYERHLARLAVEKDANIKRLRRIEDERRDGLEDAMKQRRVVEKLKERQQRTFNLAVAKENQKAADEVATIRAALDRRSEYQARQRAERMAPCDS